MDGRPVHVPWITPSSSNRTQSQRLNRLTGSAGTWAVPGVAVDPRKIQNLYREFPVRDGQSLPLGATAPIHDL